MFERVKSIIPRGSFSSAGAMLGGALGGPAGAVLGKAGGDILSRITGMGAYTLQKNSITATGGQVPSFSASGDGLVVCHREFISDINGSNAFSLSTYPVNPGQAQTFPWLSQVADQFEEYEMLGLVFEYRPSSGSYAGQTGTAALGVVVYATQYNVNQPLFTTKQQAESYEYSTSCVPFESMIHGVECARGANLTQTLLVRPATLPSGGTLELYDQGVFNIITQGMSNVYTVGELWVSYHVRFKKPRMSLFTAPTSHVYAHIKEGPDATASQANMLGVAPVLRSGSFNPVVGENTLLMPHPGAWSLAVSFYGSATALSGFTLGANVNPATAMLDGTASLSTTAGAGGVTALRTFWITSAGTGSENRITFTCVGLAAGKTDIFLHYLGVQPTQNGW